MRDVKIAELKALLVENCMLKMDIENIGEETPLFGPDGLGLDSIDALQLALAIEKSYGTPFKDPQTVKEVLQSLGTLRDWLRRQAVAS